MVLTENPKYQTENGVRPGAYIDKAQTFLGDPILSYNRSFPAVEKLRFTKQPQWMIFSSYSDQKAGIYRSSEQVNVTKSFKFGAKVQFIGVR